MRVVRAGVRGVHLLKTVLCWGLGVIKVNVNCTWVGCACPGVSKFICILCAGVQGVYLFTGCLGRGRGYCSIWFLTGVFNFIRRVCASAQDVSPHIAYLCRARGLQFYMDCSFKGLGCSYRETWFLLGPAVEKLYMRSLCKEPGVLPLYGFTLYGCSPYIGVIWVLTLYGLFVQLLGVFIFVKRIGGVFWVLHILRGVWAEAQNVHLRQNCFVRVPGVFTSIGVFNCIWVAYVGPWVHLYMDCFVWGPVMYNFMWVVCVRALGVQFYKKCFVSPP